MSSVVRIRIHSKDRATIEETYSSELSAESAREYICKRYFDSAQRLLFGIGETIPLDYSESYIYFNKEDDIIAILPTLEYLPPSSEMNLFINPEREWLGLESIPLYYSSGERVRGKDEDIK